MNNLTVIEREGQRVLTTQQLAEAYGTESQIIVNNFNRNKDRYTEGKHFYALEGELKRNFIDQHQIDLGSKHAAVLYLWTEKGAWLHAKSLNTDQAWEAYEKLVDTYYQMKETLDLAKLNPELALANQMLKAMARLQLQQQEMSQELTQITGTVQNIKETIIQRDDNWRDSINRMINKVAQATGKGYDQVRVDSYIMLEERGHCDLIRRVKNLKERMFEAGETKTAINKANKLDVIEADPRLQEIYTQIVKEMTIAHVS